MNCTWDQVNFLMVIECLVVFFRNENVNEDRISILCRIVAQRDVTSSGETGNLVLDLVQGLGKICNLSNITTCTPITESVRQTIPQGVTTGCRD